MKGSILKKQNKTKNVWYSDSDQLNLNTKHFDFLEYSCPKLIVAGPELFISGVWPSVLHFIFIFSIIGTQFWTVDCHHVVY